jgi:hypothetical protein
MPFLTPVRHARGAPAVLALVVLANGSYGQSSPQPAADQQDLARQC